MSPDTLCGLSKKTNTIEKEITSSNNSIHRMFSKMTGAINEANSDYLEGYSNFYGQLADNSQTLSSSIALIKQNKDIREISPEYVDVSKITVLQKNTMLIVWSLVAFVFFMIAMGLLSRA
jgi:hypothetical protein